METSTLECRALRHAWEHKITFKVRGGLELHYQCMRCPTTRVDTWSVVRTGAQHTRIQMRTYKHPDGYLVKNLSEWGGRAVLNDNARFELFARYSKDAKTREVKRKK